MPTGRRGDDEWTIKHGKGAKAVGDATPFSYDYIREAGLKGEIGAHLIGIVAEGKPGRLYISPSDEHIEAAKVEFTGEVIDGEVSTNPRWFSPPAYGMRSFSDLFTPRQLIALATLSKLVSKVRKRVLDDAKAAGLRADERLEQGGTGAEAYADAVATYLALAVSRLADYNSSLTSWNSSRDGVRNVFARQAIPMVWDFAEVNPLSDSSGNFLGQIDWVSRVLDSMPMAAPGTVGQVNATSRAYSQFVISTDPPYYDNIGYSDLSDYFYVWLRQCLKGIHPSVVSTMLSPKSEELVANPYRHGGKAGAEKFFVDGFNSVFHRIREADVKANIPMTVYYAYKQQDSGKDGKASTGWNTLLEGLINAGWEVTATWPIRSERGGRLLSVGTNALASSIVLACRPRPKSARTITRRNFVALLKSELPESLSTLMQGAIAPVDLAQAAIGPGISVFSRFARVREADGSDMNVKDALQLINATLDEVLGEQEADFDSDTRFAVKWYRQYGWDVESSGIADQLARSSDTSIATLERGGIFEAKGGKARLLAPRELGGDWDPAADDHVSIWEATVRLAAVLSHSGADKVAELIPEVQLKVTLDAVKELGFLLFHEAEKNKDTEDAILFNGLVSSWNELNEQARQYADMPCVPQETLLFDEEN